MVGGGIPLFEDLIKSNLTNTIFSLVKSCRDKWLRLRKAYNGYRNKQKSQIKKWKYAVYCEFLNACMPEKTTVTKVNTEEELHAIRLQIINEVRKRPILYSSMLPDNDQKNIEWEHIGSLTNVDGKH